MSDQSPAYATSIATMPADHAREYLAATDAILRGIRLAGALRERVGRGIVLVEIADTYHDVSHKHFLLSLRAGRLDDRIGEILAGAELPYAGGPTDPRNAAARCVARAREDERRRESP